MREILDGLRILTSLAFLAYASWSDCRTREVDNRVWILFAPLALALTVTEMFIFEKSSFFSYGVSFGLTAALAILIFYSGGFGGADAKALMCLALALPFYPESVLMPIWGETSPISRVFFPLTVFTNSVILVIVPVLWILSRNIHWRWTTGKRLFEGDQTSESAGKKFLVLITGYKISIDKLKEKWHVYPLEDIEEDVEGNFRRKLTVLPNDENRQNRVGKLEKAVKDGRIEDMVWASPGLPMLVLITSGLITALLLGDIVWTLISTLLT